MRPLAWPAILAPADMRLLVVQGVVSVLRRRRRWRVEGGASRAALSEAVVGGLAERGCKMIDGEEVRHDAERFREFDEHSRACQKCQGVSESWCPDGRRLFEICSARPQYRVRTWGEVLTWLGTVANGGLN